MKVLLLNGSSNEQGATFTALNEIAKTLNLQNIETEIFQLGNPAIRDCCGCQSCRSKNLGKCVFDDGLVNEFIEKAKVSDGFVFGTPVYYAHPTGRILSFLDRAFYAGGSAFAFKPACAIASARRSGVVTSFDTLNKYFTINNMPVISSTYWNNIHGNNALEASQDLEGLQTMRNLANNMVWLLNCINLGKQNGINPPVVEKNVRTNFIK